MGKGDRKAAASAAAAAELLAKRGTTSGSAGFGGFSGGSTSVGSGGFAFGSKYISKLTDATNATPLADATRSASIPATLDGELSQQLQRLSKRDATTRLKALQSLRSLVAEKSTDDLLALLPSWAYLFGRLVMDAHRGVRSEACRVMGALAAGVGRGIAPYLKALLPAWYLAQFDGHAEVTAAARASLQAAFPGDKERDAVIFCRAEVLQLLQDNLGSTPQSLGDPRRESPEELQERHERVVSATCCCAAALVKLGCNTADADEAAGQERSEAEQDVLAGVRSMLQHPAFPKATIQSKAAHVRGSGYSLVATVARAAPDLLSVDKLAPAVLGCVGEKESSNHPAMWDMLLSFGKAHPDAWEHVNMAKAFLPRLWALLRHACYGSAGASYPAVLPLLVLLPPAALTQPFFETLVVSLWEGQRAASSVAGQEAAAECFQECLLYALQCAEQLEVAEPVAFCKGLLASTLPATALPAAVAAGSDRQFARNVLAGMAQKLAAHGRADAAAAWKLAALLHLVGCELAAGTQATLQAGGGVSSELVGQLVLALAAAVGDGPQRDRLATLVGQPLMTVLLPHVSSAAAPPAASSLLAALVQFFPGQLALAPEEGSRQAAHGAESSLEAELAAARLHGSASFTIDSILRRIVQEQQDQAALAASCDLLVSCLSQSADLASQLAAAVRHLLSAHRCGAAAVLLERLMAASAFVSLADCCSAELDKVCVELCSSPAEPLASSPAAVELIELLVAGSGGQSLLTDGGQAAVLHALLLEADACSSAGRAALQVAEQVLLSQALSSTGEVLQQRLRLLAASFRALLAETYAAALDVTTSPGSGGDGEESDSAEEREHSDLYGLTITIWSKPESISGLLQRANSEAHRCLVSDLAAAVCSQLGDPSVAAAAESAAVSCTQAALAALGTSALRQALLQELHRTCSSHAAFLLCLGDALGFRMFLSAFHLEAAGVAVQLLSACAPAASRQHLMRHLAAPGLTELLRCTLETALNQRNLGAANDSVLGQLLATAVASSRSSADVAASFFGASIAASRDTALIKAVVPAVAAAFRQDPALLQHSKLPALAVQLCEHAATDYGCDEAALCAVAACFPCRSVSPPSWGQPAASLASYAKGELVWYQNKLDGGWEDAEVVGVDLTVQPPSYTVELRTGQRDTEGGRLRGRRPGEPAPPAAPHGQHPMGDHGFECSGEERQALLGLFRSAADGDGARTAAHAALACCAMAYCWRTFGEADWQCSLSHVQVAVQASADALAESAASIARVVMAAAASVAGTQLATPALALQFFRRLVQKGVLESSAKAATEAAEISEAVTAALSDLQHQHQATLLPALQSYCQVAAVATTSRALPLLPWEQTQAAVCSAALSAFVSTGSLLALAVGTGQREAALVLQRAEWQPAWEGLAAVVMFALHTADADFLRAAVERGDSAGEATGSDCVDALLALALDDAAPDAMHIAAYKALLLHPELTAALTAAAVAGSDVELLDMPDASTSAAPDVLELAGVRAELAAALAAPSHPSFLAAWALLAAHVLALPHSSGGRRVLVQCLKEVHGLVPDALSALLPLLPLPTPVSSRTGGTPMGGRRSSSGAAASPSPVRAARNAVDDSARNFALRLLALGSPRSGGTQQEFAARLYSGLLRALPVSSRLWFSDVRDKGTAAALERYTAAAVSPALLSAEYAAVDELAASVGKFDKFGVRANPSAREVVATMEVEDGHMLELVVKLPAALPLHPPEAECRRSVGVQEPRLRKWLLSITSFLRNQNGAAAGAIRLWKRNVENEFEGQEDCLICYSIIQPSTGQLPRLGCRTCRKRFHGTCLYKWFHSSGKSNCPHCQSPW